MRDRQLTSTLNRDQRRRRADCRSALLLVALSACASGEMPGLRARLDALEPVTVDDRFRAESKEAMRKKEREQEVAMGVQPGPGLRFASRCGVLEMVHSSRVAVRLHPKCLPPEPYPLIVPRFVELYRPNDEYPLYSGPCTEVVLLEVVGNHALGFVVEGKQQLALQPGDEAWCMPW